MTKDDGFFDPVIIWRRCDDRARMIREEIVRRREIKAEPAIVAAKDAGRPTSLVKWVAGMIAAIVAGLMVVWALGQFDLS